MSKEATILAAALLALILIAVSRPIALATGAVSAPRDDRWHRAGKIPRLSGPALLLALAPWAELATILALAAFCAVGSWDDYRPMRPAAKAGLLTVPSMLTGWLFGEAWVVPACWASATATNMLDNSDGTAASTCTGSLLLVADGPLGAAGAGSCLGFLAHNWPPARVFLGDGGSLMLGALLVMAWAPHGVVATLAGIAIPVLDALFVITRRIRNGRAPWIGGVDHIAHDLLRAGVARKCLPILYGGSAAALGLLGRSFT